MLAGSRRKLASHSKGPVKIGNGVVLGENVLVLSGVTIGDGAVIGAGSVVSADLPAFAIAAGNPAKVLRYRFEDRIQSRLQRVRWWDFDFEFIRQNMEMLLSSDIDAFLSGFDKPSISRYVPEDFFVVLEFSPPDKYTIRGVEHRREFYGLDDVPEIRAYFDQIKALPDAAVVTIDPYLDRFVRK